PGCFWLSKRTRKNPPRDAIFVTLVPFPRPATTAPAGGAPRTLKLRRNGAFPLAIGVSSGERATSPPLHARAGAARGGAAASATSATAPPSPSPASSPPFFFSAPHATASHAKARVPTASPRNKVLMGSGGYSVSRSTAAFFASFRTALPGDADEPIDDD